MIRRHPPSLSSSHLQREGCDETASNFEAAQQMSGTKTKLANSTSETAFGYRSVLNLRVATGMTQVSHWDTCPFVRSADVPWLQQDTARSVEWWWRLYEACRHFQVYPAHSLRVAFSRANRSRLRRSSTQQDGGRALGNCLLWMEHLFQKNRCALSYVFSQQTVDDLNTTLQQDWV
jgi:hypothetical protein